MPYFLFKRFPNRKVELIEHHEQFKVAKNRAREIRKELTVADNYEVKMIHAANEQAGAVLLTTEREAVPYGDD